MLRGTADLEQLAASAATVDAFHPDAIVCDDVVCFQLTAEMRNSARESQVPSGLHPTVPAALSLQVYEVGGSPFGPFLFASARVSCRSGVRARGFTRAVIASTAAAAEGLSSQLGYPARLGAIRFRHGYDGVSVEVRDGDATILAAEAIDPEPMAMDDVQYTGTLNLAHTPLGLRLMQVEMQNASTRVERLSARLTGFDGEAWGDALLQPARVVSASVANMQATFPAVRFVCKPDELAFTGTEAVSAD